MSLLLPREVMSYCYYPAFMGSHMTYHVLNTAACGIFNGFPLYLLLCHSSGVGEEQKMLRYRRRNNESRSLLYM